MKTDNLEKQVSKPSKKEDASDCWTHIILEAYCMRKLSDKKDKYYYAVDRETREHKKVPNPKYDPTYKTPRKPQFCPNMPQYICLEKDCPHFGYSDADKEEYRFLSKRYRKNK